MSTQVLNFSTKRRILFVQILYCLAIHFDNLFEINENDIIKVVKSAINISTYKTKNLDYDLDSIKDIIKHFNDINKLIVQNSTSTSKPSIVVIAILIIAIYEIKYTIINHSIGNIIKDYLNIAVAFSHSTESGFINSILDNIFKQEALTINDDI